MSSTNKANAAKRLLVHYIKITMEASGQRFDSDNQVELEAIVDEIIEAAVERVKEEQVWINKNREDE